MRSQNSLCTLTLQLAKRAEGSVPDILDGPHAVSVPASSTTHLIKNLLPGLTYSIIVRIVLCIFFSCYDNYVL